MRIGFTGHRNRRAKAGQLDRINQLYPGSTWVHGGAEGFDSQVDEYAKEHGIPCEVIRPDYERYPRSIAPLKRNIVIVNTTGMLVACFDGRLRGGTRYTINYAKKKDKPIVYVELEEIG